MNIIEKIMFLRFLIYLTYEEKLVPTEVKEILEKCELI